MTSSATAHELLTELVRAGVADFVLSPGSRNAPLALALAAAEARNEVRLHVRIDERSAGFLALGIARGSGRPVAVITTSGTAAVELHPAIVEASHSGIPLIAVTADRPPLLRGTGANQTIDQVQLFGTAVRAFVDIPPDPSDLTALVAVPLAAALGKAAGPIHLNVCFAPPLVPEPGANAALPKSAPKPNPSVSSPQLFAAVMIELGHSTVPAHGLILLGDTGADPSLHSAAITLGTALGWPVLAEAAGGGPAAGVLPHGPLLLEDASWLEDHLPEVLLTVGAFGVSRSVLELAARVQTHIAVRRLELPADPGLSAHVTLDVVPDAPLRPAGGWLAEWRAAAARVAGVVEMQVAARFSGLTVAAEVWAQATVQTPFLVGASWSMRAIAAVAKQRDDAPTLHCNRGANGIDGLLATAWGIASGTGLPTTALVGDLAFLYDHNSLLAPDSEARPDLLVVVVDNNGGGIFHQLEQGRPEYAEHFERVFGTAHDLDLTAISSALDIPTQRVGDRLALRTALAVARAAGGVQVVIADVGSRAGEWATLQQLRAALDGSV